MAEARSTCHSGARVASPMRPIEAFERKSVPLNPKLMDNDRSLSAFYELSKVIMPALVDSGIIMQEH